MNIFKYVLKAVLADYISDSLTYTFGEEKQGFKDTMAVVLNKLTFDYDNVNDMNYDERAETTTRIHDEFKRSLPSEIECSSREKSKMKAAISDGVDRAVGYLKDEQNPHTKKIFVTVLATTKREERIKPSVFNDKINEPTKVRQLLCTSSVDKIKTDWIDSAVLNMCADWYFNTIYVWKLEDFEKEMIPRPGVDLEEGFSLDDMLDYRPWRTYYVEDLGVEEKPWYDEYWKKEVDERLKNKSFAGTFE